MGPECSVIVLAAGRGTRMKTKTPKVLHDLCGRSLLGHVLVGATAVDPLQVVTVVRHERDEVAAEALRVLPDVVIADQDEVPGTGQAVLCGLRAADELGLELGETILVTSGDVPLLTGETLKQLLAAHNESGVAVTVATTLAPDPTGYGRVLRDNTLTGDRSGILGIVEHSDATEEQLAVNEINAGIYAFNTDFLRQALNSLGTDNVQGEVYLTDTVSLAVEAAAGAAPFVLEDAWEAEGCNDLVQLGELRAELTGRLIRRHQLAGVNIVDPATTSMDVQVELAPDTTILPCTQLYGNTVVEAGAVIGPSSTLRNVRVGPNAAVPHCALQDTVVTGGQQLGAFTFIGG